MASRNDDGIRAWAAVTWPDIEWKRSEVRIGAFHQVVLSTEGPIMRAAVGPGRAARVAREFGVAKVVADLGLRIEVPVVLDGPRGDDEMSAILITRTRGAHGPDRDWDADLAYIYSDLLTDLARAESDPTRICRS